MIGIRTPGIETRFASTFTKKASQADDEVDASYDDMDAIGSDETIDPTWDDDVDISSDEARASDEAHASDEDRIPTKVRRDDDEELT